MALSDTIQKVFLQQIVLSKYRNYGFLKQSFAHGRVILTGANGAGKTNLLEAISLLSPGRGLRRASYSDIAAVAGQNADNALQARQGFTVAANIESSLYGETQIGTGLVDNRLDSANGAGSRRVKINGTAQSAETLSEYCRVIWLIPAQDGLFTGPASDRRRFLDRMVLALDATHARRVIDYEKAMRSRNRLLSENTQDTHWLDAIEVQMATLGTAIAAARHDMIGRLQTITEPLLQKGGFPQAGLSVEGMLEDKIGTEAAIDVEDFFTHLLKNNRDRDRAAGRSLDGPHRSDMHVLHKGKNMPAALCSTGEQKALLTGLILSHASLTAELTAMTPILLLDEIAAHLDTDRRAALFHILEDLEVQAFMTGTDRTLFAALNGRAHFFHVENGSLTEEG